MKLVYLDETESTDLKRSSVAACIFRPDRALEYRKNLLFRLRDVFERNSNDATPFPVLHATKLPEDLSREKRLKLFLAVYSSIGDFAESIGRAGYSWNRQIFTKHKWISARFDPKIQARGAALRTVVLRTWHGSEEEILYFLEQGFSGSEYIELCYDLNVSLQAHTQLDILSPDQIEEEPLISGHKRIAGTYFSRKGDLIQSASDFVAYGFHLSDKTERTSFQEEILNSFEIVRSLVRFDEVD
ncbi:hypothetical protein [Tabrizicola sp.]|uniref:hypothetical protein n=1 Tax=Tabrizicola sp. TaxID=2005166 RepID=UPI002603D7E6|nr:hypothetical protein [Tabrizicola sp.]MDM7932797.1 hypothetical protein [Tabrizicola sp.]